MKKLLIMILPMLLLFGVSFADTWTFDIMKYPSQNPNAVSSVTYSHRYFQIQWISWNIINLYSVKLNASDTRSWTCNWRKIYKTYWDTTFSEIASWVYDSLTWWISMVNVDLSPWYYTFTSYKVWWWTCNMPRSATAGYSYFSWFLNVFSLINNTTAIPNILNSISQTQVLLWQSEMIFSWTDPREVTPLTIHYNGISTWYAGTDIYIDQPVKETYMSWGFLHFIVQRFRTLFRVN